MVKTQRQNKTTRLQALFTEMNKAGLCVFPTHLDNTYLLLEDNQFRGRQIKISMDNLELVNVTVTYHQYQYDKTLEDRRNAIKTAKDIFDFYHDMQTGHYDDVSKTLHGTKLPKLSLYYRNLTTTNTVAVTVTVRYSYTDFLFNYSDLLLDVSNKLDILTQTIAKDMEGEGRKLRWEKEVMVSKNWWAH